MKKPVHRAMYLEDALNSLQEMERTFAELESSDVFQTFTSKEKLKYRDTLDRLGDRTPSEFACQIALNGDLTSSQNAENSP